VRFLGGRILLVAAGTVLVFASVAAILGRVMPKPLKDTDYLVIGAVATFVALLALFTVLITTWVKAPDVFFKRRKR